MTKRKQELSKLTPLPILPTEAIYIGVDSGKFKHVAGFVSKTLLERHKHFENCPAFTFEQSREGFRALVERIRAYGPLEHCFLLLEQTGHYHRPLQQYLLECDLSVYIIHVQRRQAGIIKTDKRDALSLANQLYNQLELGVQVTDTLQVVRRAIPPSETAAQLKGHMRHRYELVNEATQRKNKLTSICDCEAPLTALREVRKKNFPSEAQLVQLQQLAASSIGTKEPGRLRGLTLEQSLLIKELRLIQEHLERLENEIGLLVEQSREGQILTSIPPIGPIFAATIIATVGNIANFSRPSQLKSYFGWAPKREQTGVSFDRTRLDKGGSREMKRAMFLIVLTAIRMKETEWSKLYERLVPRLCAYDERTQSYRGKGKVIGHVAGRLIFLIYALLKKDQEVLSHLAPGVEPPAPLLYDPELHRQHRAGHYQPLKRRAAENRIVQISS